MTAAQFVDKLNTNAGNVLSASERTTAINLFSGAADSTNNTARAQVLRLIAEDQDLYNAESNRAFVLAEFFGYLRRNPNDAPDTDYTGYEFWLNKLNEFNGDYLKAEMVKAFISAGEYRPLRPVRQLEFCRFRYLRYCGGRNDGQSVSKAVIRKADKET
jgi:hypothetical protein